MKVLVIGSGGREHALAWRIARSPRIQKVFVAPGNAGTALDPDLENVGLTDIPALIEFAHAEKVEFTVVGPEAPLAAGIVDAFRDAGLRIFGPTRHCAQLESSKDFAKAFMQRHGIPTAGYQTFTDAAAARAYVDGKGAPIVIKADGLAAGKGVVVAMTLAEAHAAIDDMLVGNKMGAAGARVVIEDFLEGEEASFIVMVDGDHVLAMATSQDHKRLKDNDEGPNTGGMGAYSPAPVVTPQVHARVMRDIILPTVAGMKKDGHAYTGFLYAGLMIDKAGNPFTIEFNCRFGDPETQPIMMRLKSNFVELIDALVRLFDSGFELGDAALDLGHCSRGRRNLLAPMAIPPFADEHSAIVDLLAARNGPGVAEALFAHAQGGRQRMLRDGELAATREQALRDERVMAMGTLAAGAAHELGTPLGTMALLAGELANDPRLVGTIRKAYQRVNDFVKAH